ncbi:MAG: hypothetical protein K9N38_12350 [Candidatus Marinimicrobia bacterium]|nr:hypothetical protein [Candidatus Neomarinimicrobiota bacterium]
MSTIREDYVLKQIERIGELITLALGFKASGKTDHALMTVDAGLDELLGEERELLEMADVQTAARLIADPKKIKAYADLLSTKMKFVENSKHRSFLESRSQTLFDEVTMMSN